MHLTSQDSSIILSLSLFLCPSFFRAFSAFSYCLSIFYYFKLMLTQILIYYWMYLFIELKRSRGDAENVKQNVSQTIWILWEKAKDSGQGFRLRTNKIDEPNIMIFNLSLLLRNASG